MALVDDDGGSWFGGYLQTTGAMLGGAAVAAALTVSCATRVASEQEQVQATGLAVMVSPDEDAWVRQPPPPAPWRSLYQDLPYWPGTDEPQAFGLKVASPDCTDYWVRLLGPPAPAAIWSPPPPWHRDTQADQASGLNVFHPEEDYRTHVLGPLPQPPVQVTLFQRFPYHADPQADQASALAKMVSPDCADYWLLRVLPPPAPAPIWLQPPWHRDVQGDQAFGLTAFRPEEDLWRLGGTPFPTQALTTQRLPLSADPDDTPVGGLSIDAVVSATVLASTGNTLSVVLSTSGPNRLISVAVSFIQMTGLGGTEFPVTVSGGGLVWTMQVSNVTADSSTGSQVWTAWAPTQLNGVTITATTSNSSGSTQDGVMEAIAFAGASPVVGVSGGINLFDTVTLGATLNGVMAGSYLHGSFSVNPSPVVPHPGTTFGRALTDGPVALVTARSTDPEAVGGLVGISAMGAPYVPGGAGNGGWIINNVDDFTVDVDNSLPDWNIESVGDLLVEPSGFSSLITGWNVGMDFVTLADPHAWQTGVDVTIYRAAFLVSATTAVLEIRAQPPLMPDADFWTLGSAPFPVQASLYQHLPYLPDPEEIPAGVLFGQPDEDFWALGSPPFPAPLTLRPLYLPDPEEVPARSEPDEDYWQLGAPPFPTWRALRALYLPDPEEVPAGALFGEPDEDFWALGSPPFPQWLTFRALYLPDPEELPAGALHSPEEDYWQLGAPPWPAPLTFRALYLPDPEEIPAATLALFTPEEDFWQNQVLPVVAAMFQVLPAVPDGGDVGKAQPEPDEDYWQLGSPPWQVQAALYQRLPLIPDPEEVPAGQLFGLPDELYWRLGPAPVASSVYQRLPYLPDPEEVPSGVLHGQPDEDFFSVAGLLVPPWPITAITNPIAIPQWVADIQDPMLFGEPDEDFWALGGPRPVVASLYQPLPYQPDPDLYGTTSPPEEFPWNLGPAPVVATLGRIYIPDPEELKVSAPPDEDFWQLGPPRAVPAEVNPIAVRQWAADIQDPAGVLVVGGRDEDFPWPNPSAGGAPWPLTMVTNAISIAQWVFETADLYLGAIFGGQSASPLVASVNPDADAAQLAQTGGSSASPTAVNPDRANLDQGSASVASITGGPTKAS